MGTRENQQKYRERNRDKINKASKEWAKANPEKRKQTTQSYRDANKEKTRQYILNNFEWHILNRVRTRCKRNNLEFNLELSDIQIPEICPYLGLSITKIQGQGRLDTNPSLDRIDPTKGYIKGNIEVISELANRMKNSATKEQLLTFSKSVIARFKDIIEYT